MFLALLKGILVGVLVSVPTGPAGFLCVERTLEKGFWSGVFSGAGCIVSDIIYSNTVVFGFHAFANFLFRHTVGLRLTGGLILLALGAKFLIQKYKAREKPETLVEEMGDFASTFLVTFTNPIQLVTFSILFGAMNVFGLSDSGAFLFVLGVFVGAVSWWVTLAGFVSKFRHRITERVHFLIYKVAGVLIVATGVVAIASLMM